jgi:hypothetical protein
MRFSREEFWVLDVTAQMNYRIYLASLNQPKVGEFFNKSHHRLTTNQLVNLLVFMQKQGDLAIYRNKEGLFPGFNSEDATERAPQVRGVVDYTPIWETPVFYPKAAILEDFFMAEEQRKKYCGRLVPGEILYHETLSFCATRQGAEKWEEMAQVDWSKYLDEWQMYMEDADLAENQSYSLGHAAALSEQTLNAWFDWKTRWDAHPDSFETSCFRRYHTERISPWKATYWKTFPEGFECDYLEYTVHRKAGMNKEESQRHSIFHKQSWEEHHALCDWCNSSVKDFPFEGD